MIEQAVLTAAPEDKGSRIDKYVSDNIAELNRCGAE